MSVRVSLDPIKGTYTRSVTFLKFGTPEEIRRYNGMVFDKEEALCIFLNRFTYPCRYQDFMLTLFRIWGGGPGGASTASSTNVGISPQNFLTFSFNPFATLV